ncbi:DUF2188 domain-containing protein [Bacillus sp. JCM 19041]|uniref:DUF2188 domain-containing protein n=1 Tax=Bacillus sp. JCM 19041 TaxID=1460637 RepID=UPI0006D0ACDD
MPWTMQDYPSSLKNFDKPVRKKAIEIANAMLDDGYDEDRAIPIATKQAKEWYENATKEEIEAFNANGQVKPSSNRSSSSSSPELIDRKEQVVKRDDGWAVQAKGAKQAAYVFSTKKEALQKARSIADNKGTDVEIHDSSSN